MWRQITVGESDMCSHLRVQSVLVALAIPLWGCSPSDTDPVDAYIEGVIGKHHIPGLALAVVKNGEIVRAEAYGLANMELDVPVTPESVFELASVTKPFTATAIMMLVEEGKVHLDSPIGTYLVGTPDSWHGVTVRHLLGHTASMSAQTRERDDAKDYTTAEMFEAITQWKLDFEPGERWQYFDLGYFLLGMIIEKQSGQRYREFLRERIFEPTGMTKTTVIDQWEIVEDRVAGYTIRNGSLAHIRRHTQIELPSSFGVLSTVIDLAKWDVALASERLVSRSSLQQMWTPVRLADGSTYPYGLGWLLMDHRGHRRIAHSGDTGTYIGRFPEQGLTVIVLTNLGHVQQFAWHLALGVAGHYDPALVPPDMLSQRTDPDPGRTEQLRGFLTQLASGVEPGGMTNGLRAILPRASRLRVSSFKGIESLDHLACDQVPEGGLERLGTSVSLICHYRVTTGQGMFYVTFWLTADSRVADFMPFRDLAGEGLDW